MEQERPPHFWLAISEHRHTVIPGQHSTAVLHHRIAAEYERQPEYMCISDPAPDCLVSDFLHHGYRVHGIVAVSVRSENLLPGPNLGVYAFFDCRSFGHHVRPFFEGEGIQDIAQYLRVLQAEAAYAGPLSITSGQQSGNLAMFTEGTVFEVCPTLHTEAVEPAQASRSTDAIAYAPQGPMPEASPQPGEDLKSDDGTCSTATVRATFLVLRPECENLTVHCEFEAPASAQDALDAVALAMPHDVYLHWSQVREVIPQISPQWGVALALPAWAHEEPILIYNLLRVDGRLYAATTAFELTREYLCRSAKVSADEVDVYAYGNARPLDDSDILEVEPYRVIFFVPKHSDPSVGHSFRAMLCTPYSWFNCTMPPPVGGHTTRTFCLVTHAWHRQHDFAHAEAPFKTELAETLGIATTDLRLQFAVPCHHDVVLDGVTCRSIVAATNNRQDVAFVDCRPILQGWHLLQFQHGRYSHSDLVQELGHFMPAQHQVQIDGAEIDDDDLLLVPGQVLIAQFVPLTSPSQHEEDVESEDSSDGADPSDDSADTMGQDTTTAPADSDGEHLFDDDPRFDGATARSRSRTPPRQQSAAVPRSALMRLCSVAALIVLVSGIICFGDSTRSQPAHLDLSMHSHGLLTYACVRRPTGYRDSIFDQIGRPLIRLWGSVGMLLFLGLVLGRHLRQCKTYCEPSCSTPAEHSRLSSLRQATTALGLIWPYDPAYQPHGLNPDEPPTPVSEASDTESIAWATALIYTPGTDPEFLTVAFRFPATLAEGTAMIQAEREPSQARNFPQLVPARPQTISGASAWVAAPHWDPDKCILLIDLTRWDGRAFATVCPTYLTRTDALSIAGLSEQHPVHVYLGDDLTPLGQHPQHARQGLTLTISPTGHQPDLQVQVEVMMQHPAMWAQDFDFPPDDRVAYCVVQGDQHLLLEYDQNRPTQYRRQLAAALGLQRDDISVFPSSPRVTNVALEGVHCRTVLAVTDVSTVTPSGRAFLIMIDCRPLLQGWRTIFITDGHLHVESTRDAIQTVAPQAFAVVFPEIPTGEALYPVLPGQVLLAEVEPRAAPSLQTLPVRPPPDDVQLPTAFSSGAANSSVDAVTTATQAEHPADTPRQNTVADDIEPAPRAIGQFVEATFLALAPGYVPEVVTIRVSIPQTPHALLAIVSAARMPDPRRRFPRLLPVCTQTFPHWGTLVASPSWDSPGIIACFDSRVDNRLYALDVPPLVTRADVLRLAGVNDDTNILVYHNNTPWPMDADTQIQVHLADLLLLMPRGHGFFVTADFSDMIRDPAVWQPPPAFPGNHRNNTWIMSDAGSFIHVMRRGRGHLLRQDLAQLLQCVPAQLILVPAQMPVFDHMQTGALLRGLLVATLAAPGNTYHTPRAPIVVLDRRPILLGYAWISAPNGLMQPGPLQARHQARCPIGHVLGYTHNGSRPRPLQFPVRVQDGDIITIEYLTRTQALEAPPPTPPPSSPPDSPDGETRSHNLSSAPGAPPQARAGGAAHPVTTYDAGTDGTYRTIYCDGRSLLRCNDDAVRRDRRSTLWHSRVVKWHYASLRDAFVEGRRNATPVLLCLLASGAACAVFMYCICCPLHLCARLLSKPNASLLLFLCCLGTQTVRAAPTDHGLTALPVVTCQSSVLSHQHFPKPRLVPTPCRSGSYWDTARQDEHAQQIPGPTLLEQAIKDPASPAMMHAATLLEVLIEHYEADRHDAGKAHIAQPEHLAPNRPASVYDDPTCPTQIRLADIVPTTPFQQDVLALDNLLAFRFRPQGQDWLDNDLEPLLQDRKVPLELRTALVNTSTWDSVGRPTLVHIDIYTDGSAAQDVNDLLPCAWAFGVWASTSAGTVLVGHASGTATPPGTPYHVGEASDTPQVAEQLALFWALSWIVEWAPGYQCPVTMHYDSLVAGRGTFGDWQLPAEPGTGKASDLAHHLVHLRQIASCVVPLTHQHVKGHAGVLQNELADQLAKQARRQPEDLWNRLLPLWPALLVEHGLAAWAWMLFDTSWDVPTLFSLQTEAYRMQILDDRPGCAPFAPPVQHIRAAKCSYDFAAITYNVLTLRDTAAPQQRQHIGMRLPGRKALLKAQLNDLSPLFVGMQETRLPEDSVQPDNDYLILQSSATERGQGGCALWIAKHVPYAYCAGKPCFVTPDAVNVLSASPRHLAVTVSATHLHLVVLVAHCPSAAKAPISEYEGFWRQRVHDLTRRPPGYDFLVLADANARVGSITSECVGPYGSETENPPGEVLHEVLHALAAFLPTTFPDIHSGPSATWVSPFGDGHRIDYFLVPQHWSSFSLQTRVLTHLELLQAKDDHFPVHLRCTGSLQAPPAFYQPKLASPVRPIRPDNSQMMAHLQQKLGGFVPPPWHVDVDDHYHSLAAFWRNVGGEWEPTTTRQPTQPYISPASEHLVHLRQGLRQYLKQEAGDRQRCRLIACFAAWLLLVRGSSFSPEQLATVARWTADLDYSEAEAWHRFHNAGELLRRQVAMDRRAYLQQLASEVSLQDVRNPKRLYAAVRKAFPTTRPAKRSSIKALPAVETPSGELAVTAEDRIATWRDHFAAQETGKAITSTQYIEHMRNLPTGTGPCLFDIRALPTLGEVEAITLTLRTGRAAGADSITSELLQLHVPTTARQLFAVFLKATAGIREPVLFRGGELVCLAKKAGATLRCSSYRSILISSVPGKVLHRRLRGQLIERLQASRPALQAGAIPNEGIEHISLAAQSFMHLHEARREPWALVFYDVQAAFYSIIRELITPHTHTDEGLLELLHRMALPPAAVIELRDKLHGLALLPQLKTSPHVTALVQDLYKGTWFRITGSALLTLTERGTRPGDPAADAVFGLAMSALLRSIDTAMASAGLIPHVPTVDVPHQWADTSDPVGWGCPAWADDFVQPIDGATPHALLSRVQLSVGLVSAKVSTLGMKLTFEREKTAALLPPWIPRDLPPQCLTEEGNVYIPIVDALTRDEHVLLLVDAYKHLGGIITANASPVVDLHHRHSRALAVVKPLRRRLFACRDIPLATRRTLLRSLAISKFAHTGAAIFLQAPSPPLALARARASFLARLSAAGPTVLTYLLYAHWSCHKRSSWLHQLEQDFEAVCLYVPDVANCVPKDNVVPAILAALVEQPRWHYAPTTHCLACLKHYGTDNLLKEISSKVYEIDTTLFAPMLRGPPGFDPSSPKQLGNKGEKHLANTPIFLHFWKKLAEAGVYKKYNYTVKVDVDTVLLPGRLSGLLAGQDEGATYFLNTAKDMYGNFLHGPVEILSTSAFSIFRDHSKECEKKISKLAYGEDFWMNNCLKHLKVHAVAGLPLLYDMYTYGAYAQKTCGWLIPEKTTGHTAMTFAAYHPYKNFWEWMQCRMQTGEAPGYPMELQKLAASKADTPIAFEFKYSRPGILSVLKDNRATVPVAVLLLALCAGIVMSSAWAANLRRQCCGQKLYIEANTVTAGTEEQSLPLTDELNSSEIEKLFPRAFQTT
ncbi:unnamed protein product [Symbiodinium sp. CCMP2592]|nr:unnamed protein product [Symbiodinium sp. CCMP2592]